MSFKDIAEQWRVLGWNTMPGCRSDVYADNGDRVRASKSPLLTGFKDYSEGDGTEWFSWVSSKLIDVWADTDWAKDIASRVGLPVSQMVEPCALLLLDSGKVLRGELPYRLVVVDVDDPQYLQWTLDTFGATPLGVTTGRDGGGTHLYYLAPAWDYPAQSNGQIGPPYRFSAKFLDKLKAAKTHAEVKACTLLKPIDVKAKRSYVICPGETHKSGRIYTPSQPITRALLESLPVLDTGKLRDLIAQTKVERERLKQYRLAQLGGDKVTPKHERGKPLQNPEMGVMDPRTLVTVGRGAGTYQIAVGDLIASLPLGTWRPVFCPIHNNNKTEAAAVKRDAKDDTEGILQCYACGTTHKVPLLTKR